MGGKIDVYKLGEVGVNIVDSPLHVPDNALITAQNIELPRDFGKGGIRKRGGMPRYNSSALAGSVLSLTDVPLPNPSGISRTLYVALRDVGAGKWRQSTDGSTWANNTTIERQPSITKSPSANAPRSQRVATFDRKLYYAGDDYTQYAAANHTAPTIRAFDGTSDLLVTRVPYNPIAGGDTNSLWITDLYQDNGLIYIGCYDPGGVAPDHRGRVFSFNPETGVLSQIGNRFGGGTGESVGGMPFAITSYLGMLWAGTYGIAGATAGRVYRIIPGAEETWTLDHTTTAGQGYITWMVGYLGELWAFTMADAGSGARILRRTASGTWSTSETSSQTANPGYYTGGIAFDDLLFCAYYEDSAAPYDLLIRAWDGSAWSTDLDVGGTYSPTATVQPGAPFIFNGDLYWPFTGSGSGSGLADGFTLKRTTSGVWSRPDNAINVRGGAGMVEVVPSA